MIIKRAENIWNSWPAYQKSNLFHDFIMNFYERYRKANDYGTGELYLPVEVHVLEMICQNPGITVSELAICKDRTKSAISQCVTRLEKKGLITKSPQANNKKNVSLWATSKGKHLTKLHISYDNEHFEKLFGILPDYYTSEELDAFFDIMGTALELLRLEKSSN